MIHKIQNVQKVRTNVFGEALIEGVVAPLKKGVQTEVDLPCEFEFNGEWTVTHLCSKCNENIQFGSAEDGLGGFVSNNKLKTLFSRYYSVELLEAISQALEGTKVLKSSKTDWFIVTDKGFNDENAEILFIPKRTVLSYQCSNCSTEYLCLYRMGIGAHPERGNTEGRHNKIAIDEIIQIDVNSDSSFLELVSSHIN